MIRVNRVRLALFIAGILVALTTYDDPLVTVIQVVLCSAAIGYMINRPDDYPLCERQASSF
jgi:hypothetical protein